MTAAAFVVTAAAADCLDAGELLFFGAPSAALTREELRPPAPFEGPLFELLAALPAGIVLGLVVPAWPAPAAGARGGSPDTGDLVAVADHVNLEPRGPLTGRWPAGEPRDFPGMTAIYQPSLVRPPEGARVYSSGVVAAGVADARRLTRFEVRAVREGGWPIVTDSLVPATIVAAHYGMRLAAFGLVQAPTDDRE